MPSIAADTVRAIAKEAYIYGFPIVDSYRVQYDYFVDRENPEFKAPWNELRNIPRVFTPEDTAIVSPNSDTPYSILGMDLRTEPMVLTVPPVEPDRYFSIQLIDAYTHNFDYIGSRATGNDGGSYLVAGPGWNGDPPAGVTKAFRSETELVFAAYRTQLFGAADLDDVKQVQAGYRAEPLSAFLGTLAPAAAPAIDFVRPLTPDAQKTSLEFFAILNFALRFCPTHPTETDLMARFAQIGVGADQTFDARSLVPEMRAALEGGMADAWAEFAEFKRSRFDTKDISSGAIFGTRAFLQNNYLYRMLAAVIGLYGNSREEAMYPAYAVDADGQKLDGAHRYALRFAPGGLPPVHAFWSLTMYRLPESLLVANPLDRYLLNSPMLPQFRLDADDGLTLLVQHESPGEDGEANWLPAPTGPFWTALRLYWPMDEAISGTWTEPSLQRVS
jgi:hypothetical protein